MGGKIEGKNKKEKIYGEKIIVAHNGIIWLDGHSIIRGNLRFKRRVLLVVNTVDCLMIRSFEIEKLNTFYQLL